MAFDKKLNDTVRGCVSEALLADSFLDSAFYLSFAAYEMLFGAPKEDDDQIEVAKTLNRIAPYAYDALLDAFPELRDSDCRKSRDLESFHFVDGDFVLFKPGENTTDGWNVFVTITDGVWTAYEYDSDGDLSHRGYGSTPQAALDDLSPIIRELERSFPPGTDLEALGIMP